MTPTPDPIDIEVGARIRARRQSLSVSQERLADALGLTFQRIEKYERGVSRVPTSMLVRIAWLLDVTVAALVGEDEKPALPRAEIFRNLGVTGALTLLNAYAKIQDADARRVVVCIAEAVAGSASMSDVRESLRVH